MKLQYIDVTELTNVKGNTYYLKANDLYLSIKNDTIENCWRKVYDDFGEETRKIVDVKTGAKILIDLEIGFE